MDEVRPMQHILDFWAKSMNCPVCQKEGLAVTREPGVPDLLCCPKCGSEFYFEHGGTRIRLVQLPNAFHEQLYGQWVTYEQIRQVVAEVNDKSEKSQPFVMRKHLSAPIPVTGGQVARKKVAEQRKDLPPKRAFEQARRLFTLGNSIETIQEILESDPRLTKEQVEVVINDILAPVKQKRLERLLIGILVVFALGIISFILVSSGAFGFMTASVSGFFPEGGVRLLPGEPKLTYYNPTGYHYYCPQSQVSASQLFGGRADRWTFDNKNWNYLDVKAVNLFVPEGLSASYSSLSQGFNVVKVEGPVMLDNILALSIDCFR
jgi:hypothetical protein